MAARNMYRIEINVQEKELRVVLVIYKDYTELHGQQNIKFCIYMDVWQKYHETVRTSLSEDEHLDVRNMWKTL